MPDARRTVANPGKHEEDLFVGNGVTDRFGRIVSFGRAVGTTVAFGRTVGSVTFGRVPLRIGVMVDALPATVVTGTAVAFAVEVAFEGVDVFPDRPAALEAVAEAEGAVVPFVDPADGTTAPAAEPLLGLTEGPVAGPELVAGEEGADGPELALPVGGETEPGGPAGGDDEPGPAPDPAAAEGCPDP
jgi:hypothetical protein